MADEKTTADNSAVEDFSDEALTKALEAEATETAPVEKTEETATEQPAVEAATTEPEKPETETLDQKESSKLGRKFKGLESKFEQIMTRLDQLAKPATAEPDIELPEVVATVEDVEKILLAREAKARKAADVQTQTQKDYQQSYMQQLNAFSEVDGELHDEVMELITENAKKGSLDFNEKYSENASADARINYAEAKAAVLAQKLATSGKLKVPARETATKAPVQPAAAGTKSTVKTELSLPKLEGHAASYVEYLRRQGTSEAEIAESLKQ